MMPRPELLIHDNLEPHELRNKIRTGEIVFAGNKKLKIFGLLRCKSGKRMLKKNRVFFAHEHDAVSSGYRPCAHCMRERFRQWKAGIQSGNVK